MKTDLLNEVVSYLAVNGVTPENTPEFKNAVISLTIKTLHELGMSVSEAMDFVLGDGFFRQLSDTCWAKLNS